MAETPIKDLRNDIIGGSVASLTIILLISTVDYTLQIFESLDTLTLSVTTLFGFLFTILPILYTFESEYEDNKAIQELKENGRYNNIIGIFLFSIITIIIV